MHGINRDNMMATSCSDTNSTSQFVDSGSNKSQNQLSKEISNHNISHLPTLTHLKTHQNILQQPLVHISSMQLPQQMLQNQFLKGGQAAHVGPMLPTGSLPNFYSALQYQILVQALQQGLISVSPASQSVPIMNTVENTYASATQSLNYKLNSSHTSAVSPSITKNNGILDFHKNYSSVTKIIQDSPVYTMQSSNMKMPTYLSVDNSVQVAKCEGYSMSHEACTVAQSCSNVIAPTSLNSARDLSIHQEDKSKYQKRKECNNASLQNISISNSLVSNEKTDVLTHIIEGYIIQEGSKPFPIERTMYINEFLDSENEGSFEQTDEDEIDLMEDTEFNSPKAKNDLKVLDETKQCHCCGIFFHPKTSVSRTGKFCSVTCSKRTAACSRWMIHYATKGLVNEKNKYKKALVLSGKKVKNEETDDDVSSDHEVNEVKEPASSKRISQLRIHSDNQTNSSVENSKLNQSNSEYKHALPRSDLPPKINEKITTQDIYNHEKTSDYDASSWGVSEVCKFIQSLSGCGMYADDFKRQEIDGQALLLLTEEHLMSTMNIKLGPALKICSNIRILRENVAPYRNVSN